MRGGAGLIVFVGEVTIQEDWKARSPRDEFASEE
jgi:hypothetical protein